MNMPGKKKRATTVTVVELAELITAESNDYKTFMEKLRENFFHKDVDSLIAEIKHNHDSLMKNANQHRKIDEIIELRDSIEHLSSVKATQRPQNKQWKTAFCKTWKQLIGKSSSRRLAKQGSQTNKVTYETPPLDTT